ncbi:hypothetical protein CRYUN_Cryun02cG0091500 [Craigia yunnanensis]
MAAGPLAPSGVTKERVELYQGRVTLYVIIACIVAAIGGSIFGYDIGISGCSAVSVRNGTNSSSRSPEHDVSVSNYPWNLYSEHGQLWNSKA